VRIQGCGKLQPVQPTRPTVDLQRPTGTRVAWASLLVLALLWTQSMGLWHRLVHSSTTHPALQWIVQAGAGDAGQTPTVSGRPFSNHLADTDCQLFDQLSHADGVAAKAVVALAQALQPHVLRSSHALAVARWHALFQARGPPSVR